MSCHSHRATGTQSSDHATASSSLLSDIGLIGLSDLEPIILAALAEAESELKAARHFVEQNCELLDEAMAAHCPPVDLETRVQIRWNAAYAVELCRRATERIFAVSGAHAIYGDHPLQKMHRDINTASHHAIVDFDGVAEIKGRLELGLTNGIGLV